MLLQLRTLKIWKHLKTIIFSVWYLQGKSAFEQLFENWNTVSSTLGIWSIIHVMNICPIVEWSLIQMVFCARELHSHYTVLPISGTFTFWIADKIVPYSDHDLNNRQYQASEYQTKWSTIDGDLNTGGPLVWYSDTILLTDNYQTSEERTSKRPLLKCFRY